MNKILEVYATGFPRKDGMFLMTSSINADEIEYNIDAIERFFKVQIAPFEDFELKIFRVLNLVCVIFPPSFIPSMLFIDFFDNEDSAYDFIKNYNKLDMQEYAKEILIVFHDIRENYKESDGSVKFLDADEDFEEY